MDWPKQVPILTADDIHKGSLQSADGTRCCLLGWGCRVFGSWCLAPYTFREAIYKEAGTSFLPTFNDSRKRSKQEIADVWNRAMARLGYTDVFDVED